jgi:hypothetical protein
MISCLTNVSHSNRYALFHLGGQRAVGEHAFAERNASLPKTLLPLLDHVKVTLVAYLGAAGRVFPWSAASIEASVCRF